MSIRVTQQTMYNKMVGGMQHNLGAYMESMEQGSSQKKVNRPSDDPAGTYRILTTRVDMTNTAQYQENVDTAKGWLKLADDVLSRQTATAITGLKALAEQASTGTYNASQRQIMADQARQYFGQLLNLANTEFEGKQLFAGHKYDSSAFQMGMAVTTWDEDWNNLVHAGNISVDPNAPSDKTIIINFTKDGALEKDMPFKWSDDGGNNWQDGTVEEKTDADGNSYFELDANGVITTVRPAVDENGQQTIPTVKGAEKPEEPGAKDGTTLYIRPAAFYQGDDKDPPAKITVMGNKDVAGKVAGDSDLIRSEGTFGKNVVVNIESVDTGTHAITYSYSTDGGSNWITPLNAQVNGGVARLPVPGGYMEIDESLMDDLTAGTQLQIHPSRADLGYEIMKDTYLTVNGVGKDIFGGWYNGQPVASMTDEQNLFEVVGSFIGYLEGNNQEGCQRTLAALTEAEKTVLAEATRIGGMENRVEMASDLLSFQKIEQQERLSYVEDIDLTELLSKLTRQQIAYQTVLQSSSMIMNMSLANYI